MNQSIFPERIDVFPLPDLVPPGYRPECAVFIDVLRATTTMTAALEAGVRKIIPVLEPKQAVQMKEILEKSDPARHGSILLGGERKGVPIDGFDLGNSPSSYTPESVGGKTLLFSTTNGTRAILTFERAGGETPVIPETKVPKQKGGPSVRRTANRLPAASGTRGFLASFTNARAVTEQIRGFRSVGIVCAGTDRKYTEEDILLAGLLVSRLTRPAERSGEPAPRPVLNVQAETAKYIWETFLESVQPETLEKSLYAKLLASRGGQNVQRIRLTADIRFAAQIDSTDIVPEYRLGEIILAQKSENVI